MGFCHLGCELWGKAFKLDLEQTGVRPPFKTYESYQQEEFSYLVSIPHVTGVPHFSAEQI